MKEINNTTQLREAAKLVRPHINTPLSTLPSDITETFIAIRRHLHNWTTQEIVSLIRSFPEDE